MTALPARARGAVAVAAACAALLAAGAPSHGAPGDPPAETPAATYDGRPIPRAALHGSLSDRALRTDAGPRLLDQFLSDLVAEREREKRGIEVTDAEIDALLADTARRAASEMKRDGDPMKALEELLKEKGASLADLRARTASWVSLQKMARPDLGASGDVSPGQIELWLRDLKRRRGCSTGPGLPQGQVAVIDGEPVGREALGRWLVKQMPPAEVLAAVLDLAFQAAVEARAAAAGTALRAEEVEAEIARLERQFMDQPDVEGSGIDFAQWLERARGLTMDEFRRDGAFRAEILARRLLAAEATDDALRKWHEERAHLYDRKARIRRILVRGESEVSRFGPAARPMAEARRIAARAMDEIRAGKEFGDVARRFSDDPEAARGRRFDVSPTMPAAVVPQSVLDVVFTAEAGAMVGPVEAVDGMHIVLVERTTPAPTFEEVRDRVRLDLLAQRSLTWKASLRTDPLLKIAPDLAR